MLKDQIPIDRDGHANRQLLAAIQNQLHNDYDGRLPFLLLPVRIETRFMQVDRPVAGDSINSDLLDRLGELKNNLGSIAGRNLAAINAQQSRRQRRTITTFSTKAWAPSRRRAAH